MKLNEIKKIDVFYNERKVGMLFENDDLSTSFIYDKNWIETGFSISPFKLPLEQKVFVCNDYLIGNLFGVFNDCLPDSWGNMLVNKYLAQLGFNPINISFLQRLTLLDNKSIGALSFKPHYEVENENNIDEYDAIYKKIEEMSNKDIPLDLDIYHKGSSTGGSRPKINIDLDNNHYILKYPGRMDPKNIGEEEYKLNLLARKCGINVPDCKLIPSKVCSGYFATKRFDYINGKKKHVISLAGLFDLRPDLSQIHYLGLLQTVYTLCQDDLEEAVRRMIFNYFIGNKDDHPRNFSFIYDEVIKSYRLAPFYDITSTPQINEHMMQVNGKDNPSLEDFIIECDKVNFRKEKVIEIYNEIKMTLKNN